MNFSALTEKPFYHYRQKEEGEVSNIALHVAKPLSQPHDKQHCLTLGGNVFQVLAINPDQVEEIAL